MTRAFTVTIMQPRVNDHPASGLLFMYEYVPALFPYLTWNINAFHKTRTGKKITWFFFSCKKLHGIY
jgi:hypothetical protein